MDDLAVQVGEVDRVEIHHADMPHARRRQIGEDRCTEPTRANHDDPRRLQLLLTFQRDLGHDEMTTVTADLFIGKGHVFVDLVDAGDETHGGVIMLANGGCASPGDHQPCRNKKRSGESV